MGEQRAGRARDTRLLTTLADQHANWLAASSVAAVSRFRRVTAALAATITNDPTRLPACTGAQTRPGRVRETGGGHEAGAPARARGRGVTTAAQAPPSSRRGPAERRP